MNTNQGTESNSVQTVAKVCRASYLKLAAQIRRVRENLVTDFRGTLKVPEKLFRLALNEAEALAWETEYPHLVFPTLATEKVRAVGEWNARQEMLRHRKSAHAPSI